MRVGLLTAAAAAFFTTTAAAQVCVGYPTVDRGMSFGASLDFPDGGDRWGVEASYDVQGPLSLFGGVDVTSVDGVDDSTDTFFIGGAANLFSLPLGTTGNALGVCPTAQFRYTDFEGGSLIQLPIGLGVGTSISVTPTVPLMPYAIPSIVMSRFSVDDGDSETEWDFGIRAGALVGFGIVFVGAEVEHIAQEEGDTVFGIRAGIRL